MAAKYTVGQTIRFDYTGSPQTFSSSNATKIKIECYGASGAGAGGKGGYAFGELVITDPIDLFLYVGSQGGCRKNTDPDIYGYNGGGWSVNTNNPTYTYYGGGATDVRTKLDDLYSRIVVSGGGGSQDQSPEGNGGVGGGYIAPTIIGTKSAYYNTGGSQTAGGAPSYIPPGTGDGNGKFGSAGYRYESYSGSLPTTCSGPGGGGWYGGATSNGSGGFGGSSYIAGDPNCPTPHPDGIKLTNTGTTAGVNSGDGYCVITILEVYGTYILCKNSSGVWGWRNEASTNGHTKIMKSSDNRVVMEAPPSLDINYTGAPIALKLSPGNYKMECWGAAGGWGTGRANPYGKGGYTVGEVSIVQETTVWLYIGRRGSHFDEANFTEASFNGGGYYVAAFNNGHSGGGGGGGSDIRLVGGNWNDSASLISRIMVAGGGGGGQSICGGNGTSAGHGGGLTGTRSYNSSDNGYRGSYSNGGSQTAGGTSANMNGFWHYTGSFGKGANSDTCGAGGGGGYYGGGASYTAGGGGGSSFISGLTGCNAVNASGAHTGQSIHYSGLIFRNASTTGGVREGDGAIKITLLEPYTFGTYIVKDGDKIGWRQFKSNIDLSFNLSTIGSSIPLALRAGRYKVELWGASGEGADPTSNAGSRRGRGAYTAGELNLPTSNTLYLFIGGSGGVQSSSSGNSIMLGGYNGGGDTYAHSNGAIGGAGGGATDLRLIDGAWDDITSLRSRIMVAGGGGGSDNFDGMGLNKVGTGGGSTKGGGDDGSGGDAGGLSGGGGIISGTVNASEIPPGTQTSGYAFGKGGNGRISANTGNVYADTGGGGGGYYGGYGSDSANGGGAGGSSFISGYPGCNAVNANGVHTGQPNHYSGLVFVNGTMTVGGNDGNGKAKITLLEYF